MSRLTDIRNKVERLKGRQKYITQQKEELEAHILLMGKDIRRHEQAREIVRQVGLLTQQQLQFHISDVTSLALEAVFDNPYELLVEFIQRRNKTECDLLFERDGKQLDPMSATGGGAVDIAAFALRIASWSMKVPRTRQVIILDEPMRFLSANYMDQASAMLKDISTRLGLQFIIVTHEPVLATYADKVFEVKMDKHISKVK